MFGDSPRAGVRAPRYLARDCRAAASTDWRQRGRVAAILSGHGKPPFVRRIARLRCDARFRFPQGQRGIARAIRLTRRGFGDAWAVSLKSAAAGSPSRGAPDAPSVEGRCLINR